MQTPQKSLSCNGAPKQAHKTSPAPATPHTARRRLSMSRSQSNSPASLSPSAKTAVFRSPRASDRKLPRSPASEKRLNRIAALESQVSQLEEDLEKTKDLLAASRQEAEETREQLAEATSELEHADRRLREQSESEDERIRELRKIGQERDRAWQSELEAVRTQHSVESTALLSAVNELQRLRTRCDMLADSEAMQGKLVERTKSELCRLKQELAAKDSLVDTLRKQVVEFEKSEAEYQESINVIHLHLEMSKNTVAALRADGSRLAESHDSLASELEGSRAKKMNSLKETAGVLVGDEGSSEVELLRSALEAVEMRYQEEQIKSTASIHSAYEATELARAESARKEAELEKELKEARSEIAELKGSFHSKKGGKCRPDPVQTKPGEIPETRDPATLPVTHDDSGNATMEAAEEQLKAARALNSKMEVELHRVRVQAQQWRKAAEVAAAIIASGGDGAVAEKMGMLDLGNHCDEERRSVNMLKRIGVLLRKGQR